MNGQNSAKPANPSAMSRIFHGVMRMEPRDVRFSLFSCVFQNAQLSSISLKENIACREGDPDSKKNQSGSLGGRTAR